MRQLNKDWGDTGLLGALDACHVYYYGLGQWGVLSLDSVYEKATQ
jgi:hypothetical protein